MTHSTLVTYATRFGSTEEVAQAIAAALSENGLSVTLRPMSEIASLAEYDAVVVGSAVNYAKWLPAAADFVREHQETLAKMPVALFTVHIRNIAADAASRQERLAYLDEIRPYVRPVSEGFFAGRFNRHAAVELIPRWLALIIPTFDLRKWDKIQAWAHSLPPLLLQKEQLAAMPMTQPAPLPNLTHD
jgi:menaquinone-dependent protoporphyrinogen oxidase